VLTVVDTFALMSSIGSLKPFIKNENDAARGLVEKAAERLKTHGLDTVTQVVEGHPASCIVEQADVWNADFIIIGSHGHSGLERFLAGSVAKEVLRNAHCSVEIVRIRPGGESHAGGRKILLATDGSAYSRVAAQSVAERRWESGSEVRILSVIDPVIPAIDPWYGAGEALEEAFKLRQRQCEEAMGSAHKLIEAAGLRTTTALKNGSPKWRIIDEANEWVADVIVLGSHGRRGLKRMLLGSVSEAVALNARCSVEVIRSRAPLSERENEGREK
jgi:nucleotide-binding universal stress UspA family protein